MQEKLLALTFDDGPGCTVMPEIMKLLHAYGAGATFFVVGENISPVTADILVKASEQGFEIGNHSQSHLHMTMLSIEQIRQEVSHVQSAVRAITGKAPVLFRPPYLDVDERLLAEVDMPFIGGHSNLDWDPGCSVAQRVENALRDTDDGSIMLMHCFEGNEATVDALKILLPEWINARFRLVSVSQLFSARGLIPENGALYDSLPSEQ